jgi:phenylacetate-CoA ligase
MAQPAYYIPEEETLARPELEALQRRKLSAMWREVTSERSSNQFYRRKFAGISFDPLADPLDTLPLTTRAELEADQLQTPPYGTNLTDPRDRYCRLHQTSGSKGVPLRWLDTADTWTWWKRCWGIIFTAAGVTRSDVLMFPFSFGPFIGFWGAFESAVALGMLSLPAGGMTTTARLRFMKDNAATVVCCTPTYALRMAEVAREEGFDLPAAGVRRLVVAGEPGGSIPEIRNRIESAWGARVFDHTGMTEMGPLGFECEQAPGGVHLMESECIAEILNPATGKPVPDAEPGELVLTNLGRWGSPLIRYRTGDQVRVTRQRCACGRWFARMVGGIAGRIDDMIVVRGNNVFPTAVEAVIRRFPEVAEFRVVVEEDGALTQVLVELEPAAGTNCQNNGTPTLADRVGKALQDTLNFRAQVRTVSAGALPRFEMKARRFVRQRGSSKTA